MARILGSYVHERAVGRSASPRHTLLSPAFSLPCGTATIYSWYPERKEFEARLINESVERRNVSREKAGASDETRRRPCDMSYLN